MWPYPTLMSSFRSGLLNYVAGNKLYVRPFPRLLAALLLFLTNVGLSFGDQNVYICSGFVRSSVSIDFSKISVRLLTLQGNLKYQTDYAQANGYYMIPVYAKGTYVLRVRAPEGWNFEPEGVELSIDGQTDPCSRGEHVIFSFSGFSLGGKVIVSDTDAQVVECEVSLFDSNDQIISSTKSIEGSFVFPAVLPGTYRIGLTDPNVCGKSVVVTVGLENDIPSSTLFVTGFSVQGKIRHLDDPVEGVTLLLYSERNSSVQHCDTSPVERTGEALFKPKDFRYSCKVKSSWDGSYRFPCVSFGVHAVVPMYRRGGLTLQWEPKYSFANVVNRSVTIKESFEVKGFAVQGSVVWNREGPGVNGAQIYMDNKFITSTNEAGLFVLTGVKTGSHSIVAKRHDLEFAPLNVAFSSKTVSLPPIIVERFQQCGKVEINHFPSNVPRLTRRKLVFTEMEKKISLSTTTDREGYFCAMLPRGTFVVEPQILNNEKAAGIALKPATLKVIVANRSLKDISFRQFESSISGQLHCLEKYNDVHVSLFQDGVQINRVLARPDASPSYKFQNVFPGVYTVIADEDSLCWERNSIGVTVKDKDISSVDFKQSGFTLAVTSSHSVDLYYRHSTRKNVSGIFNVPKGRRTFCLPVHGIYYLNISSCHIFREQKFTYDTVSREPVILQAVKHGLQFKVKLEGMNKNFEVVINSAKMAAPVILQQKDAIKMIENESSMVYTFMHYSPSNDDLNVVVKSSELVITPNSMKVNVEDDCQVLSQAFHGTAGVFLKGHISPSLPGVFVTIHRGGNLSQMTAHTDVDGRYRVGPFHSLDSFEVEAMLDGYWFEPIDGEFGSFVAHRFSELTVEVADSEERPLSGVLVVISGNSEFRMKNLTNENGRIIAKGIGPGDYFVHAFMKEYSFQPANKPIRVNEGSQTVVKLIGIRVAFSCFGQVKYLAGMPVSGVIVEAIAEDCDQHQEEAISDEAGMYSLRGLQTNCEYTVRLKPSSGDQIAWPIEYKFAVAQNDSSGFDFTFSPVQDTMDVIGYVDSDPEYLPTLTVHLQRIGHNDLYSEKIDNSSMFMFPSVPADGSIYTVRLSSSIIASDFEPFSFPEITVVGNTSLATMKLSFRPMKRQHGYGSTRGSYFAFPIGFLVAVIAYNFTAVSNAFHTLLFQFTDDQNSNTTSWLWQWDPNTNRLALTCSPFLGFCAPFRDSSTVDDATMALVTIQRSPTPSLSLEETVSDMGNCSSETSGTTPERQTAQGSSCQSECYFAVKGAAVILAKNDCSMHRRQASSSGGGDIQHHLQSMLQLLRPQDTLKMAVRLESLLGKHTRYLAIVSACGRQDNQESIVVGIDYTSSDTPTIGLVLPLWATTSITLDGDGGICIESDTSLHVFKPISVQAMWSVYQTLHKVHAVARSYPYYPGGWTHTWVQFYESHIDSPEPFRSEWHIIYHEDSEIRNSALERFRQKPPERKAAERTIRDTLKDIMQSVDLDEVTSKDIREKLEERLEMNLKEYKEFIDQEMLVILGQMDKPSQVFPYLYLGTEWNASNWDELKHNNVGFILNVTKEVDNFFPGLFHYLKIRISDEESSELLKFWDITFKFIVKAREINSSVLVHCKKGISRSSSTVIAYAMKEYGFPLEEALNYVKEKRNCITPNRGFMEQLKIYEGILDASRNRTNILWNSLSSEKALYDNGLMEEHLSGDRKISEDAPGESVIYSCKDADDSFDGLQSDGLLVASENILKSGPVKAASDSQSTENFIREIDGVCRKEADKLMEESGKRLPVSPCDERCNDAANQEPDDASTAYQVVERTVVPSSRYSVRRRLLHLEQRIQDQQLTLKSLQNMLMSSKRTSFSNSDSLSSSSGEESDFSACSALTDGDRRNPRRNSKSSSGDSAITDLTGSYSSSDAKQQCNSDASSSVCVNSAVNMPFRHSFPDRTAMVDSTEKSSESVGCSCSLKCQKSYRRSAEDLSIRKANFNIRSGQVMRALKIYESQPSRSCVGRLSNAPPVATKEAAAKPCTSAQEKKPLAKFWEGVFQKTSAQPFTALLPKGSCTRLPLPRTVTTKWHCNLQSMLTDSTSPSENRKETFDLSLSETERLKSNCAVAVRLDTLAAPFTSQPVRVVARKQECRSCGSTNPSFPLDGLRNASIKRITSASDLRRKVGVMTEQSPLPLDRLKQRRSDDSLVRSLASIFEPCDLSPLSMKHQRKPTFFVSDGEISNDQRRIKVLPTRRSSELSSRHGSETDMSLRLVRCDSLTECQLYRRLTR
uniref:protein-serine/threonine phosphatase n=1 Tax=Trichuris muris TaxID=70415 RepID=A0A5S6QIU5_TRIMR